MAVVMFVAALFVVGCLILVSRRWVYIPGAR
jgi:hypothetical protein